MLKKQIVLKTLWHNANKDISQEEQTALDQYSFHHAQQKYAEGATEGALSCTVSRFDENSLKETKVDYKGYWMMTQSIVLD